MFCRDLRSKVVERGEETTQLRVEPGESVLAKPQHTQGAGERGHGPRIEPRQPAVVEVQPGHGQVGKWATGVERQAPVAVEEQLVETVLLSWVLVLILQKCFWSHHS